MNKTNQVIVSILGICSLFLLMIGVSYAFFTYSGGGTTANTITTGTITFSYSEQSNGISLTNAFPMTDASGKVLAASSPVDGVAQGYFDFTVSGQVVGNANLAYEIYAKSEDTTTIDPSFIKVYLTNGTSEIPITGFTGTVPTFSSLPVSTVDATGKKLYSGIVNNTTMSQTFRLRTWIADTYTINDVSKTFKMKVYVQATA